MLEYWKCGSPCNGCNNNPCVVGMQLDVRKPRRCILVGDKRDNWIKLSPNADVVNIVNLFKSLIDTFDNKDVTNWWDHNYKHLKEILNKTNKK